MFASSFWLSSMTLNCSDSNYLVMNALIVSFFIHQLHTNATSAVLLYTYQCFVQIHAFTLHTAQSVDCAEGADSCLAQCNLRVVQVHALCLTYVYTVIHDPHVVSWQISIYLRVCVHLYLKCMCWCRGALLCSKLKT